MPRRLFALIAVPAALMPVAVVGAAPAEPSYRAIAQPELTPQAQPVLLSLPSLPAAVTSAITLPEIEPLSTVTPTVVTPEVVPERVKPKPVKRKAVAAKTKRKTRKTTRRTSATNYASGSSVWDRLAQCESGGNWAISTGNGFYGGIQFTMSSWRAVGGSGNPANASREEQIARGEALRAIQGWGAWPACSRKIGVR